MPQATVSAQFILASLPGPSALRGCHLVPAAGTGCPAVGTDEVEDVAQPRPKAKGILSHMWSLTVLVPACAITLALAPRPGAWDLAVVKQGEGATCRRARGHQHTVRIQELGEIV